MPTTSTRFQAAAVCAMSALVISSTPVLAADTPTGIVAGLGITAASGKSTLAGTAGAIEASLLTSDAMLKAGAAIRKLVQQKVSPDPAKPVIILGHSDTIDLSTALWLPGRIEAVQTSAVAMLKGHACDDPPPLVVGRQNDLLDLPKFAPKDVVATFMTDTSIGSIAISADDRQLVNAVEMAGRSDAYWHDVDAKEALELTSPTGSFFVPGETVAANPDADVVKKLSRLQDWVNPYRHCTSNAYKAAIQYVDAFVGSVSGADKGIPAIVAAAELEPFTKAGVHPYVLRVAIESTGGTSVARSNIWYALGFPGAVSISSGLLVSFRLSDPATGTDELVGEMRCALKPTNLRDVHRAIVTTAADVAREQDATRRHITCAYRLA